MGTPCLDCQRSMNAQELKSTRIMGKQRDNEEEEFESPEAGSRAWLLPGSCLEIAIHVDATERFFDGIDHAVLITIQLLKMLMSQIGCLRTWHAGISTGTWIVALGIFEHSVVNQVRPRLDDRFGDDFLVCRHQSVGFSFRPHAGRRSFRRRVKPI